MTQAAAFPALAFTQEVSYEVAMQVYEQGRYSDAADLLRRYALEGDALAQLRLATLYRTGSGVEADEYEAAMWYAKAAEQGVAEAQFHLGLMYLEGVGVTEDSYRALEWVAKAARQGYGDAIELYEYILSHDEPIAC